MIIILYKMLPTEIWVMIIEYLEPHEIYMAQFMNKQVYNYFYGQIR